MGVPYDVFLKLGALCLVMGIVMYMLYRNGWMVLSSKSAVTFIGSNRGKSATFSGCSGSIKRIVRCAEDREYRFSLDAALTKGDMSVSLLGPDKRELLRLTESMPQGAVTLEKGTRYTLVLRFRSATGRYVLQWN